MLDVKLVGGFKAFQLGEVTPEKRPTSFFASFHAVYRDRATSCDLRLLISPLSLKKRLKPCDRDSKPHETHLKRAEMDGQASCRGAKRLINALRVQAFPASSHLNSSDVTSAGLEPANVAAPCGYGASSLCSFLRWQRRCEGIARSAAMSEAFGENPCDVLLSAF